MKIIRLIFLYTLLFSLKAYSQIENDYKGLNVEFSTNIIDENNNNLWTIRPNITYNHKKVQFTLGPVSKILVHDTYHGGTYPINIITGFAAGAKIYMNEKKKDRLYYYIENIYLNYHSTERLEVNSYTSDIEVVGCGDRNNAIIIQPVISSGYEFLWFKTLSLSIDFGFGWTFRKYNYPDWYSTYYPTQVSNIIGQLKFGLGYVF